jgi:cysteine desulfurase/selenocysteine lyase
MTLDGNRVRRSFPILERLIGGRKLVYFDNAATSLTPEEVLGAELAFYRCFKANVHRGRHALSEEASGALEEARAEIARFIGASADEVVFTAGTTAGLNMVADGLDLPADAEVLTMMGDHHSTILPWRRRWQVRTLETSPLRPLDPDLLRRALSTRTKAVVLSHASNVTGLVQPLQGLCRIAREHGLVTVIDGAQSVPHLPLDVRDLGCDFLAFSGHKMLGPTGVGALYGRRKALECLRPRDLGGGAVERVTLNETELRPPPGRFEAGTPNIAGVLGFAAAVRYIEAIGWGAISEHGQLLARTLRSRLSEVRGVRLLSAEGETLPIVSLSVPDVGVRLEDLSAALSDRYGIMTRSGLMCAQPLFKALRWPEGALRISAYLYNTVQEVEWLSASLGELLTTFAA